MAFQSSDPAEGFRRDRREHGGAPEHLDDDRLAHEVEEERVEAGVDPYDPDEVLIEGERQQFPPTHYE